MIKASDLLGCVVSTESGRKLGRVHDLRATRAGDGWLLTGLGIGTRGMLTRLTAGGDGAGLPTGGDVVPWQDVIRLGDGEITVRDESAREGQRGAVGRSARRRCRRPR